MSRKLRPRSVYDVMAAIACFGVLAGGTAYAANTIRSGDIVDGEVKTADLDSSAVTTAKLAFHGITSSKLADGSVGGRAAANDSFTGADLQESTLGKVPDADELDGKNSSEFGGLISGRIDEVDDTGGIPVPEYGAASGVSTAIPNPGLQASLSPNATLRARRFAVEVTSAPGCQGGECDLFAVGIRVTLMANGNALLGCTIIGEGTSCVSDGPAVIPARSRLEVEIDNRGVDTNVLFGWQATP